MKKYQLMPAQNVTNYLNENFPNSAKNLKNLDTIIEDGVKYFKRVEVENICLTNKAWRYLTANVITIVFL